ncbi:MAG: hydrogenase expression/formation protein HypE [Uliginosibacterium sp.]|nr:hydrogenase expression/formation protein HypE [Uliginosibacterium sp.]
MKQILLAHGNGGRLMRELLTTLIFPALKTTESSTDASAIMSDDRTPMLTSDSFTVQPLFFPGGNIGSLAIHGTLNDLAVSGAEPAALTFNLIIEEGFEIEALRAIVESAGEAVSDAGVRIVAGDTKVVPRGQGSGLVIATTGLGWRAPTLMLGMEHIRAGDAILVSGPVGDHGATVLMAREAFGLSSALRSDAACVLPLARQVRDLPGLRFMRDPTRGGLATVMHEIACATGLGVLLDEKAIPIRAEVQGVCQLLGFNPLMLACEGRIVVVAAPELADQILTGWREDALGTEAARIGTVVEGGKVCLLTALGGHRFIDELSDDPLPRIC